MSRCPARRCAWLRKAPAITPDAIKKCGRGLAREGGLTAELDVGSDRVHIRYLGHSHYGFRPYGGSLLERPKSNQKAFAPTLGTSPRLGVPVIRQVFGGPPPRAIHGAGRLNRHPCRFTPQIPVEFRPACLTGRPRSRSKARARRPGSRPEWCGAKANAAALKPTGVASVDRGPNVGGGLLSIAVCQLMHLWLPHRYREQAPSHSLISIHQADISLLLICF